MVLLGAQTAGGGSRLYKTQTPVTAPLLHRKPRASLPIPHMGNLTRIVPNASNRSVVGQNTSFFCPLYRRDPSFSSLLLSLLCAELKRTAAGSRRKCHSGRSGLKEAPISGSQNPSSAQRSSAQTPTTKRTRSFESTPFVLSTTRQVAWKKGAENFGSSQKICNCHYLS
jgi:hypothetical protein